MSKQIKYHLAFSYFLGIGPMRFKQLVNFFGNCETAYQAKEENLKKILGVNLAEKFMAFRRNFSADSILENLLKKNIQVLTLEDKDYPQQLAQITDPPICLYVKGNKKILSEKVGFLFAVIGTRKPTNYGISVAEKFAGELSQYGFTIVSGMALGIDSKAHWAALNNNGATIAVLGCGVDIIYPPTNRSLYETIIQKQGAVVSEFPPGRTVLPGLFVARNRIISGLSKGILVVEGAKDSGALITARYGAEQGREVFAPPSPITSLLSQAPNYLIKQGAKITTSIEDILDEFNIKIKTSEKEKILENLEGLEKTIVELLLNEEKTADELSQFFKKPISEILNALSLLEIKGAVGRNPQGQFFKK